MKNYIKQLLVVFCALFTIVACNDDDETRTASAVFDGPHFVAYEGSRANVSLAENATDPLEFTVVTSQAQSSDLVITLNITGVNATQGVDYELSGVNNSSVTIPAGEYSTSFSISSINDNFFNADDAGNELTRQVVITLASNSANLTNGLAENASRTVTLVDDDCPIDIASFVGVYEVAEVFTAGTNEGLSLANAFGESYQVELSLMPNDPTGTKVVINNSPGYNVYLNDGTVMTFSTCDKTVVFDAGFPEVALFRVFEYTASSYDEDAKSIKCEGPLATFGPYEFVLTKQ